MDLRTAALDSVLRAPVPRVMELGTGNVITRLSKDIDTVVITGNAAWQHAGTELEVA